MQVNAKENTMTYADAKRLLEEKPDWLPVLRECVRCARKYGEFAGKWVFDNLKRQGINVWKPSLRSLAARGILKKVRTAESRRTAYYQMPDISGVERAIAEMEEKMKKQP